MIEQEELERIMEAILFAAGEPVPARAYGPPLPSVKKKRSMTQRGG